MSVQQNSWTIRRRVNGLDIYITANWIEGMNTWGMTCKVNDELTDHRQADDVFKTSLQMIEIAHLNNDALQNNEPLDPLLLAKIVGS